ncbi:hypothetical protein E2C01_049093 [Portunus trituberculatus]|uniref:Uncharacterized protein n=1 Tax=Portunus trituberculatus TaxID=210409 RepID=A0A5B7GD09_PORTR|nr:hypothetical protein [Portunus trituberculatus]
MLKEEVDQKLFCSTAYTTRLLEHQEAESEKAAVRRPGTVSMVDGGCGGGGGEEADKESTKRFSGGGGRVLASLVCLY